jgi:hypothetical protein
MQHGGDNDDLPPWVTSADVMTPLLRSYDESQLNLIIIVFILTVRQELLSWSLLSTNKLTNWKISTKRCANILSLQKQFPRISLFIISCLQIEEILAENEALRESHLDQMRHSASDGHGSGMGPMGPLNMELLNELNERVEILMTENALMVEQKAVLSKGMY